VSYVSPKFIVGEREYIVGET